MKKLNITDFALYGLSPERERYSDAAMVERLKGAIGRFNPNIPKEARNEAARNCLAMKARTIAALRDALIPKLMSGEIRVSTNNNLNNENK